MTDAGFDPAAGKVYHCKRCGHEWTTLPLDINEQGDFREIYGRDDYDTRLCPVLCTRCYRLQCEAGFNALKEKFGWQ